MNPSHLKLLKKLLAYQNSSAFLYESVILHGEGVVLEQFLSLFFMQHQLFVTIKWKFVTCCALFLRKPIFVIFHVYRLNSSQSEKFRKAFENKDFVINSSTYMTPSKLVQNMRGDPKRSGNVNGLTRKYFFHKMTIKKFLIFTLRWNKIQSY